MNNDSYEIFPHIKYKENKTYICFGFTRHNSYYFEGFLNFIIIDNMYLIDVNILLKNYKEYFNILIENKYIEQLDQSKFKYKIGPKSLLELI